MHDLIQWIHEHNVEWLVKALGTTFGYIGLPAIVFTETGLLIGFFLPGDSLLFTAGLASVPGNSLLAGENLNLLYLCGILSVAAIIGDTVGYWLGYRVGVSLYQREKTFFFRRDHLLATKEFYEKHGGATIVYARFVPFIRTFAPVVAGIAQMPYRRFVAFNIFGGIGWVVLMLLLGYFLGQWTFIRNNLDVTIIAIVFISLLPAIVMVAKGWLTNRRNAAKI